MGVGGPVQKRNIAEREKKKKTLFQDGITSTKKKNTRKKEGMSFKTTRRIVQKRTKNSTQAFPPSPDFSRAWKI